MARKKSGGERIEPTFDASDSESAPRVQAERRAPRPKQKPETKSSAKSKKKGRSLLGGLFYWGFVLWVWVGIGAGGLFVYYGSQLPQIDHSRHSQAPAPISPFSAATAACSPIAATPEERRCGSRTSRLICQMPLSPSRTGASTSHFGLDPHRVLRAPAPRSGRGVHAGRLDPYPAARQKSLPRPRTALFRVRFRRPRWRSIWSINIPRTRFSHSISTASISAPGSTASRRRREQIFRSSCK